MKIALLSDTHGWLDDRLLTLMQDADEIWHAGDIGSVAVIDDLQNLPGKLRVVHGNIDSQTIRTMTPADEVFTVAGARVLLTHIAGTPPRYNSRVKQLLAKHRPNILVCGHSHILKVMPDKVNNLLFINPGACGNHGFHKMRTFITFHVTSGQPHDMQVIELGKRGKLA